MGCKTLREGSKSLFYPPSHFFPYAEKDSALAAKWRHCAYSVPTELATEKLRHPIVAYLVLQPHCCIFFAIPSLHILRHPIVAYLHI